MPKLRALRGFTLLELSITLVIIALVTGMALQAGVSMVSTARLSATQKKMTAIDQALMQYRTANGRLPCPGDLTLATSNANYGLEAGAGSGSAIAVGTGACTGSGMLPQANFTGAGVTNTGATAAEGSFPALTLGLPADFMVDGWGNRIRYAVDVNMTAGGVFAINAIGCSTSAITINDAGGTARSSSTVYALISHGPNGHGAYTNSGSIVNTGSANTKEQTNCHCSATGVTTTTAGVQTSSSATYVQADASLNPANALDSFDDIVTFKERWQMQMAWDKPGGCTFVYVLDAGNNRSERFDSAGNFIASYNIGSGCCNEFIKLDTAGNFFLSNRPNGWVDEYTASAYVQSFGSGTMNSPNELSLDGKGNIWVADGSNHRILKYQISGATATLTQTVPASCAVSCSASTANGSFDAPYGLYIDASGNIWVADYGINTQTVQEFDKNGNFLQKIGPDGGGFSNGQFSYPTNVALDSSGNIWVVDRSSNRIQKFNSSGVYQSQLGCATGPCSTGSANGQFNDPEIIGIDSSANIIYVVDKGNNRVQKFNTSGVYLGQLGCASGACSTTSATGGFNGPRGIWFATY
jgi:prepilin-type N-terminal cleavage/methylation domain-containing protein